MTDWLFRGIVFLLIVGLFWTLVKARDPRDWP
jgi:hypothetical protein